MRVMLSAILTFYYVLFSFEPSSPAATPVVAPLVGATSGNWQYFKLSNGFPYDVLLPYKYSTNHTYPVILYLHGRNAETPSGTVPYSALSQYMNSTSVKGVNYRAQYPAIVVAPQCMNSVFGSNDWGGTHTSMQNGQLVNQNMPCGNNAIAALKAVMARYSVNPRKIYLTGYSMGGFGVYYLYAKNLNLFAAAIPVSGNVFGGATVQNFEAVLARQPLWAFQGFDDTIVSKSWDENLYTLNRKAGGLMHYTEFTVTGDKTTFPSKLEPQNGDGHYYADMSAFQSTTTMSWLFSQSQ
jgi:predicted peptidase